MATSQEVPVYLFTGFLESGKTQYIQETLEDTDFNEGERTLLLICEEGINEYESSRFCFPQTTFIRSLNSEDELTLELLQQLQQQHDIQRVLVEYNGMWMLNTLFENLPENWVIYQEFMFADAQTFLSYNDNMRQLTFDKINTAELVVFNRWTANLDKEQFHRIVRGASRSADIIYEHEDHTIERDDIADPLPFDIDAPVIHIEEEDYAIWYRDISEDMEKYDGKTVHYKAMVSGIGKMPKNIFIPGRFIMACCENDIGFAGLICECHGCERMKNRAWIDLTAKIKIKFHPICRNKGPVLTAISIKPAKPAAQEVATFY